MLRITLATVALLSLAGCSKKEPSADQAPAPASTPAPAGAYLTVGVYCTAFCNKLCATCGMGDCPTSCNRRCDYGRSPDLVFDGKDPKIALALTQQNLDACLATITKESCMSIAAANVPPACYTIQH
jgi:hypothetical protein